MQEHLFIFIQLRYFSSRREYPKKSAFEGEKIAPQSK